MDSTKDAGTRTAGSAAGNVNVDLESYNIVPVILGELAQLRESSKTADEQLGSVSGVGTRSGNSGAVLLLRCSDEAFDMVIHSLDGQDLRLAVMLLQRQVDFEEQTQASLSHLTKLYRQTSVDKFLATAQQLMASQQRLASVRSRILRCVSKQIASASDGQIDATFEPLIDRVLRYPDLSSRYIPANSELALDTPDGKQNKANGEDSSKHKGNGHPSRPGTLVPETPAVNTVQLPDNNENDEDTFERFIGPSVSLSPLVSILMQRMDEGQDPVLLYENKKIHRQRSESYPERPRTPLPPMSPDDDISQEPLSPLVDSLLGKSFSPLTVSEDDVMCESEEGLMAAMPFDSSTKPSVVVVREKKMPQTTPSDKLQGDAVPAPPRRTSSYDVLKRRSQCSTGHEEDRTPSEPSESSAQVSPSKSIKQEERPTSQTPDRQQFKGSVQNLFESMRFSTMNDGNEYKEGEEAEDSREVADTSVLVARMLTSMAYDDDDNDETDGPEEKPHSSLSNTAFPAKTSSSNTYAPTSREAMLATANAGVRKERTVMDTYEADLAALLTITDSIP